MKIQFNTDNNIQGSEALEIAVSDKVNSQLKRFAENITRVEVHMADVNSLKGGPRDIHCKIETRVEGLDPMWADSKSDSKEKALDQAVGKMKTALTTVFDKMKEKRV